VRVDPLAIALKQAPMSQADLYNLVADQLWSLLDRWRTQAQAALAALAPDATVAGTLLDGRLLQTVRLADSAGGDPVLAVLTSALSQVLSEADGSPVGIQGFDPGGGAPRGLALVLRDGGNVAVAALTGAGPRGLAFEIAALGAGGWGPVTLALQNGWSVDVSAQAGARLQLPRGAAPSLMDGGAPAELDGTLRHAGQPMRLGPDAGPHLDISTLALAVRAAVTGNGLPQASYGLNLSGAQLSLAPGPLAAVLGDALALPLDVSLAADPLRGLSFGPGGLQLNLPVSLSLPGVSIDAIQLNLDSDGPRLRLGAGLSFTAALAGLPLSLSATGLGASMPVNLGSGALGVDPAGVQALMPTGIGMALELPLFSGGGFVQNTAPGTYAGLLELSLGVMAVDAFGLLQLPSAGAPLGFVALVAVRFPPPGIQLGLGFSVNGVGGIVGVNRRLDPLALSAAVFEGRAEQLLFPVDAASHAPAIISTLGQVFPAAEGHVLVGPMLLLGWGGRLVELAAAVVIELPDPLRLTVIAKLTVALPDPALPLVKLVVTLFGAFELSPHPGTLLTGSLAGSEIVGIPLRGDLLVVLRSGDDALFVLSAGGFHPRWLPPPGVPRGMHRIALALTPPGVPGLRAEAYVALTTNSVQFGANLELNDEIAGCGVNGHFNFDVLFVWDPTFAFAAHANAGVAVQVLGETLAGINFDLVVEGPAPWHVHGTGSIDLFLFSASLDFDAHWGSPPAQLPPPPDPGLLLANALADASAWVGVPPALQAGRVSLSDVANHAAQNGHVLHPLGGLVVRQRAVPLNISLTRVLNQPIEAQRWALSAPSLAPGVAAAAASAVQDEFPPAQFIDLSQDEKLSRPSFEPMDSGLALTSDAMLASDLRGLDTSYELFLMPDFTPSPALQLSFVVGLEQWMQEADVHALNSLWTPPGTPVVSVLVQQPVAPADTQWVSAVALTQPAAGYTAVQQAAVAQFGAVGPAAAVQVVEAWELAA